jgi:hypothetical protein
MYANTTKICFNIKGKRETFFKDKVLQFPPHPQHPYEPKRKTIEGTRTRTRIENHNRWS